jgi:hypothetical protein
MISIDKTGTFGIINRSSAVTISIFVVIALAVFSTLRPQEMFSGGDYSLYIMHALNLASFSSYADTNYIHNAANSIISPKAYPPGFPILLSMPIAVFGLSFTVLKAFMAVLFVMWLYLFYRLLRKRFSPNVANVALLACAFSPAVFERRDAILSDVPFALFCFVSLHLYLEAQKPTENTVLKYIALTISMSAAISVRSIGIVLPLVICLVSIIPGQRHRLYSISSSIISVAVVTVVYNAFGATSGTATYFSYFDKSLGNITARLLLDVKLIYWLFAEVFAISLTPIVNAAAALLICVAMIYGFSKEVSAWLPSLKSIGWHDSTKNQRASGISLVSDANRSEFAVLDIFFAAYVFAILLFPVHTELTRYLIPIIPLLFWYLIRCLQQLNRIRVRQAVAPLLVVLAAFYLSYYSTNSAGATAKPIEDPENVLLLQAISRQVAPTEIILAENPRVVALFANRKASIWPQHPGYKEFWSYADGLGADFVLFDFEPQPNNADHLAVDKIIKASGSRLQPVFKIGTTTLFRICAGRESAVCHRPEAVPVTTTPG